MYMKTSKLTLHREITGSTDFYNSYTRKRDFASQEKIRIGVSPTTKVIIAYAWRLPKLSLPGEMKVITTFK